MAIVEPGVCGTTPDCIPSAINTYEVTETVFNDYLALDSTCRTGTMVGSAGRPSVGIEGEEGDPPPCEDFIAKANDVHGLNDDIKYQLTNTNNGKRVTGIGWACGDQQSTGVEGACGVILGDDLAWSNGWWFMEIHAMVEVSTYEDFGSPFVCPPGYELLNGECVKCNSTFFEILNNVNFADIADEDTAIYWESQDVKYNQISQSDFVPTELDNIAHFGDHTCEYIKQPLTINNGEYRYNNTITLKIEFSYIDVRTAKPDSKIVINLGGELEIFDIARIKEELTGDSGLYSYNLSSAVAYIEFPAPAVNPGEFAIAEMWQMGDIILEVTQFGILGYDPCVKTELYDIEATEEVIECTTVPVPPCIPQYLYNQDLYRRQIVTFKTDIQGLIPQYLDKIMISHSALQWGEAGQVAVRDLDNLTLSENLVDLTDGKTIVFRDINGDISGAYGVGILDEYNIQVPGMPEWVTVNTFYTIQEMATAKEFLVISVRPSGDDVTIECVNYDENIYKDGGC